MILRGSLYSNVLEMETGVTIVTPQTIPAGGEHRIAYLLHGLCGSHGNWADFTMLPFYARRRDVVFVMPEVGRSFYTDMRYGGRYCTYVADELPEICRNLFRLSAAPADTAVIGGSMGGYGALKTALSRPGQYGYCAAFAASCLFAREQMRALTLPGGAAVAEAMYGGQILRDLRAIFGDEFAVGEDDDILALAARVPAGERPRLYTACGTADDFRADNRRFHQNMVTLGYDITYEEWPGGHDWRFFDTALGKALTHWLGDPAQAGNG